MSNVIIMIVMVGIPCLVMGVIIPVLEIRENKRAGQRSYARLVEQAHATRDCDQGDPTWAPGTPEWNAAVVDLMCGGNYEPFDDPDPASYWEGRDPTEAEMAAEVAWNADHQIGAI